jgi:uncharacterized membrane protein YdjX (TVP38/TMEM64 family)
MLKDKKIRYKLDLKNRELMLKIFRNCIFFFVIGIFVFFTIKYSPLISKLMNENYRLEFKENISQMGFKGVFIVLGLQVLQIVVAVLPGQPIELISGMLYGTLGGTLLCTSGIFIGVLIVFFLVRKFGIEFMQLFFSKEKIDKIRNSSIFEDSTRFEIILFLIFLTPIFPKDIFIYIGGITKIKAKRFIAIATFARIPGQMLGVYTGSKISQGNYLMPILIYVIVALIGIAVVFISKKTKLDKKINIKDVI